MYTNPKISASLTLVSLIYQLVFPQFALTDIEEKESELALTPLDGLITLQGQALVQSTNPDTPVVIAQYLVPVTGYSSTPDQTDAFDCLATWPCTYFITVLAKFNSFSFSPISLQSVGL